MIYADILGGNAPCNCAYGKTTRAYHDKVFENLSNEISFIAPS